MSANIELTAFSEIKSVTVVSDFDPKKFAANNFKLDKNGKKFFKCLENTVGKGENAHYNKFLLFQCFQKTCTAQT